MEYPRDCVPALLGALRRNDRPGGASPPLPDAETLAALLDVAFAASMEPDEGRFATFGFAFIRPGEDPKAVKSIRFAKPVELSSREVMNLAAATDATATSLAVWREAGEPPRIWGLVTSESQQVGSAPAHGHPTYLLHAPSLVVRARAPGVLYVYHWRELQLLYVRGTPYFRPPSGRLQGILRDEAGLAPRDAEALSQIATRISLFGHGGTLLLTSRDAPLADGLLDVTYRFDPASPVLRAAIDQPLTDFLDRPVERHALDFVAQLSQVDGAVHLTSDLEIQGFGAKIRFSADPFALHAEVPEGGTRDLPMSEIPGTRHRSAAMFCAQQSGALAIVISQDGDVSLFERRPDRSVLRMGPFALGTGLAIGG